MCLNTLLKFIRLRNYNAAKFHVAVENKICQRNGIINLHGNEFERMIKHYFIEDSFVLTVCDNGQCLQKELRIRGSCPTLECDVNTNRSLTPTDFQESVTNWFQSTTTTICKRPVSEDAPNCFVDVNTETK